MIGSSPSQAFASLSLDVDEPDEVIDRPYPGLRPFVEDESHLFFGRDKQRDECIRRLRKHRFLAVVGTSGAGKSSLVKAAIVPALKTGLLDGGSEPWRELYVRPGASPMASLAAGVRKLRAPGREVSQSALEAALRRSSRSLLDVVSDLNENRGNVLLVVDQFEELFRLGKEKQTADVWLAERAAFVQRVLEPRLQSELPLFVIITMRTDFLENCASIRDLPEALNEAQFLVPRLARSQLEQAVAMPAEVARHPLAHSLVKRILADAIDLPDELPVVQHALMRTWQHWQERLGSVDGVEGASSSARPLPDVKDYEDIGTVERALNLHGDILFGELLDPSKVDRDGKPDDSAQLAAKVLFQRITLRDATGKVTRSPAPLSAVRRVVRARVGERAAAQLEVAIAKFREESCRFLMPLGDADNPEEEEVDITHEAVLRVWNRVGQWIAEEHENAQSYRLIAESERRHHAGNGQLLSDRALAVSFDWWKKNSPSLEWGRRYHVPDDAWDKIAKDERDERSRVGNDEAPSERLAREERYRALRDAWHRQQFERADSYLRRSERARLFDVCVRGALGVLALGTIAVIYWVVAGSRQNERERQFAEVLAGIKDATKDANAAVEWNKLDSEQKKDARASKAVTGYWSRRVQGALERAEKSANRGCAEEALAFYAYAARLGPPVGGGETTKLIDRFRNVSSTLWLREPTPSDSATCAVASDTSCRALDVAADGSLIGLCAGSLRRWDASGKASGSASAPDENLLSLNGNEIWTASANAVHVRAGVGEPMRTLQFPGCSPVTALAVSSQGEALSLAVGCNHTTAFRFTSKNGRAWVETLGEKTGKVPPGAVRVSLVDRYINDVSWVGGHLVLATDGGLAVDGQLVARGSRPADVLALRAFSDRGSNRLLYGTAQNAERAATVVVVEIPAKGRPTETPQLLARSKEDPYFVKRVVGAREPGEIAALIAVGDERPPRSELFLPQVRTTISLEAEAQGMAIGRRGESVNTAVALPGRIRVFTGEDNGLLDWDRIQTVTGLTIQADGSAAVQSRDKRAVPNLHGVFPGTSVPQRATDAP